MFTGDEHPETPMLKKIPRYSRETWTDGERCPVRGKNDYILECPFSICPQKLNLLPAKS
jgi:hypothetical protein